MADELDCAPGKSSPCRGSPHGSSSSCSSGAAVVRRNGRKIRVLGPGDLVGEIALMNDSPRTATVTVTEPSRVLVLTARDFRRLLQDSPDIAMKVLAVVGERLNDSA